MLGCASSILYGKRRWFLSSWIMNLVCQVLACVLSDGTGVIFDGQSRPRDQYLMFLIRPGPRSSTCIV
jgi:hypothetical protein